MEIDTQRLTPGMVLAKDVVGKSGNTIIAKDMKLTEVHIEFIEKFLIETVSVSPLVTIQQKQRSDSSLENPTVVKLENQLFVNEYETFVTTYRKLFSTWKNNVPIDMFDVRSMAVTLFEKTIDQTIGTIISLTPNRNGKEFFYNYSVSISLLAVFLAHRLNYEKKDWLQIGFAALLSDVGMAKMDMNIKMHPIYSYKMVEKITTLTQQAKMGILQHEERLDGSGYPAKVTHSKIHPYARIIAVSDFFFDNYRSDIVEIIHLLEEQYGSLDETIVKKLISLLKK